MLCESTRRHVFELYRWNADQFHDKALQRLSVFSKKSKQLISEHSDLPVMPVGSIPSLPVSYASRTPIQARRASQTLPVTGSVLEACVCV